MRGWIKKPWASLAGKQYTASQIALAAQDDGGLLANQTPTCARARSETLSFGSVKVQPILLARLRATLSKPASTRARCVDADHGFWFKSLAEVSGSIFFCLVDYDG